MGNKKVDYATRKKMLNLYIAGYTTKQIAEKFGLNREYVGHILHSKFTKLLDIE